MATNDSDLETADPGGNDSAAPSTPQSRVESAAQTVMAPALVRFEVVNNTPRRIAIPAIEAAHSGEPEYLVISPFSSKVLSDDAIREYDTRRWEREDLIKIEKVVAQSDDSLSPLGYGVGCSVWLLIYLGAALLVPILRGSIYTWIIFAVLVAAMLLLVTYNAGGFKDFQGNMKRLGRGFLQVINLALLLIVVLGLGVLLFYLFSGGRDMLMARTFPIEGLARVIQYIFLTIATLLPALMYFLFNRRQRAKVQENFIREVLRLDPGIRTITEAEFKYLGLVRETFGTNHTSAFMFSSGLPIFLCTLLIFMGWLLVIQPFSASSVIDAKQLEDLLLPRTNAVTFAFLGAYFFAISLVFRRYVRADLTPKTYTHIILRLLLAIILAWTLSALPIFADQDAAANPPESAIETEPTSENLSEPEPEISADQPITATKATETDASAGTESAEPASEGAAGLATGLLYLLAFFIGIFPETGLTVLKDLARNPLFTRMFPRLEEEHPLTRLDGINLYDRSRFLEEGIENVENLAHHSLIGLMLSTRISTNRLVDLFDQAILYLHLGLDSEEVTNTRKQLRVYGIRTATDLEAAYKSAEERDSEAFAKFLMILDDEAAQPEPLSRVQTIIDTLRDDDWMTYLRNWRELNQRSTQTFTLKGVTLVPLDDRIQEAMRMAL